jgi:hypothetical protein
VPDRLRDTPPTGRLLLVSPHLDDVALSCGALLDRPEPVDVLTVFAGHPDPPQLGWWDRKIGFASSTENVTTRRAENETAFSEDPHRLINLSLLEIQYTRGRRSETERDAIAREVRSWLGAGAGTVGIPAGAGLRAGLIRARLERRRRSRVSVVHPDHLFVRDAVLGATCDDAQATVLLYEELPYLWGSPADSEVAGVSASCGRTAQLVTMAVNPQVKANRIAAYQSQVPYIVDDGSRLDDPNVLPPVERYWYLAPTEEAAPGSARTGRSQAVRRRVRLRESDET